MPRTSALLYPDWQPQYEAALLEVNHIQLEERIHIAHKAIAERIRILAQDHFGTPQERQAIEDALNGLGMLRREVERHGMGQRKR